MADKRFQVFLSSTYLDLLEERRQVVQTLLEMDCIPAGMELFPAVDQEQLDFIKKVIDDCDYYLLIIGGRYGGVTAEGVSFTESEYDYAIERGLKVVALLHAAPDDLAADKVDGDPALMDKLRTFRARVETGRLVKYWKAPEELSGLVATGLQRTMKLYPAVGWVRGDTAASEQVLAELNEQRKQNAALQERVEELEGAPLVPGIASLDEPAVIRLSGIGRPPSQPFTWRELFVGIAPMLMERPHEQTVLKAVTAFVNRHERPNKGTRSINEEDFQTVRIHLMALGLVDVQPRQVVGGGTGMFWTLTSLGTRTMLRDRSVKGAASNETTTERTADTQTGGGG